MPRRKNVDFTRNIGVDARFNSSLIQKMINVVMERGKKNIARTIVYDAMDILIKKSNGDQAKALALFEKAFSQVVPHVEVRSRRVGGSVYQVPREVSPKRKQALGIRWIIQGAQARTQKTMGERLAYELLDAVEGKGGAIRKKTDVQRMADANRAFSHYAW
ncbi:MAG TPA: 30S ribosomal protein S7 [Candidatus Dependentiae bacterium]|nr:30S ribosomal protein S7 [Candidatus Dependentiae bacterium]HRQ62294.1 30S ribosomal protein S7 [Candidatus Dependentiae bacterium]